MSQTTLTERDYLHAVQLRLTLRRFLAASEHTLTQQHLTSQRYDLLLLIKTSAPGQATVSKLAPKLSIGQSATTQLVRRAERDGLLKRRFAPDDARVHHLILTQQGSQRLAAAVAALGPQHRDLLNALASERLGDELTAANGQP